MKEKLNPNDLVILINIWSNASYEPVETEAYRTWINDGIVAAKKTHGCELTDRGLQWLEMILGTPYPVKVWVDPRERQGK